MQKRVFIIHGWGGRPDTGWLKWLNKELSSRSFQVYALDMPEKGFPKIGLWVPYIKKIVGKPDKNTYFIGHSIGCQAILRYLEKENVKVGGCIFVGGWLSLNINSKEEEKIAMPWLNEPINFSKIKEKIKPIVAIFSDNDPYVPIDNADVFKEKLNAAVIIEKGKGHYLENVTSSIPILLKKFLEMSKC